MSELTDNLKVECGYDELGDTGIDSLIDYKNALEDSLDAMVPDLVALLDYAQPDEERDFEQLEEGNSAERHIVHVIRRLREYTR